ncbi:MAG: YiiX/YebB-like N1pC/P60 family cysteine hydrolase [Flavobacterium sp.]
MSRIFYLIPSFLSVMSLWCQSSQLKTGDLLFQKMNCGVLCEAIHAVTEGFDGNDFSHLGLVIIEKDSVFVLEAAGTAVRMVTFEAFAKNTSSPMFYGRLKKKYRKLIPKIVSFSKEQLGLPYDDEYLYDNGKYYCSELIYDAFKEAYGAPFFELTPMTFKQPDSEDFFPAWVDYYNNLNIEIPEGALGCNPGGISSSEKLVVKPLR